MIPMGEGATIHLDPDNSPGLLCDGIHSISRRQHRAHGVWSSCLRRVVTGLPGIERARGSCSRVNASREEDDEHATAFWLKRSCVLRRKNSQTSRLELHGL